MGFNEQLNQVNVRLNAFSAFVVGKLKHYPALSLGEKVSYPVIGTGLVLMLIGFVLLLL